MAHNGTQDGALAPKQEALAFALASGRTIREAAAECGAGERTVKRWLAEQPAVVRRVAELRANMVSRALGRMADGMTEAAATLRALLNAKGESVRLGAARSILELGNRLRESVELEERLIALEQRAAENKR
jgi:hypothetical protein